jgi:predicted acylesterase/phospholipase RssA
MTRRGLYLQGGGTKGAYQAGVMKALHETGITFEVVSGTSIGSINGFYWAIDRLDELEKLWFELDIPEELISEDHLFLNNAFLLDEIKGYAFGNSQVKHWYVNYAQVKNQQLINRYEDLNNASMEKILEVVGYSTRLPLRDRNKNYNLNLYEGMMIDGGMINNTFVEPLVELGLDEIVIIPLNNSFESASLDKFRGKVTIIAPPMPFQKGDTVRLEKPIIRTWFNNGYEEVKTRYSF